MQGVAQTVDLPAFIVPHAGSMVVPTRLLVIPSRLVLIPTRKVIIPAARLLMILGQGQTCPIKQSESGGRMDQVMIKEGKKKPTNAVDTEDRLNAGTRYTSRDSPKHLYI